LEKVGKGVVRRYEDLRAVLFHASNQLRGLATSRVSEYERKQRRKIENTRLELGSVRYKYRVYQNYNLSKH